MALTLKKENFQVWFFSICLSKTSLGEDAGLELSVEPSKRTRYISLVVRLPKYTRNRLASDARYATSSWKKYYYLQNEDHYHLTLFGNLVLNEDRFSDQALAGLESIIKSAIHSWAAKCEEQPILTLTKLTISKASINCEVKPGNNGMQQLFYELKSSLGNVVRSPRDLHHQSVSMVRFLVTQQDPKKKMLCQQHLKEKLLELENAQRNFEYQFPLPISKIHLTVLDKVADNFQIKKTIPLCKRN